MKWELWEYCKKIWYGVWYESMEYKDFVCKYGIAVWYEVIVVCFYVMVCGRFGMNNMVCDFFKRMCLAYVDMISKM